MARYDIQDTAGDTPNSAIVPGNINAPVIFLAPSERTTASGELWIATSSTDPHHGGCVVWVSNDDADYKQLGRVEGQARQGVLLADLPAASGTDTVNALSVDMSQSGGELESVSLATVNRLDTLCYVGGEFIAFRDATLIDVDQYDLEYLKRGLYGSTAGALTGADFVAVDNALYRYRFNKSAVGEALYFKFQAFNEFGAGLQDLADCTAYAFVPGSDGGIKALKSDLTAIESKVLPSGGTAGQVLEKQSGTDYDAAWVDNAAAPDLSGYELLSHKGAAGGYAPLDAGGYLPVAHIPDAILHHLQFKGTFDGSVITSSDTALNGLTAIPAASSSNEGYFFISTGAYTSYGKSYLVGDWAISIGTSWEKIDNTDAISSFNGRSGAITLLLADVTAALGFAPADSANVSTSTGDSASSTKWPVWSALVSWVNSQGFLTSLAASINAVLTGYTAGAGTVSATDTIKTALQKLDGNIAGKLANITGLISAGSGISISGSGTAASPYSIANSGGLQQAVYVMSYTYSSSVLLSYVSGGSGFIYNGITGASATAPNITLPVGSYIIKLSFGVTVAGRLLNVTYGPKFSRVSGGTITTYSIYLSSNLQSDSSSATSTSTNYLLLVQTLTISGGSPCTLVLGTAAGALEGTGFATGTIASAYVEILKIA